MPIPARYAWCENADSIDINFNHPQRACERAACQLDAKQREIERVGQQILVGF